MTARRRGPRPAPDLRATSFKSAADGDDPSLVRRAGFSPADAGVHREASGEGRIDFNVGRKHFIRLEGGAHPVVVGANRLDLANLGAPSLLLSGWAAQLAQGRCRESSAALAVRVLLGVPDHPLDAFFPTAAERLTASSVRDPQVTFINTGSEEEADDAFVVANLGD